MRRRPRGRIPAVVGLSPLPREIAGTVARRLGGAADQLTEARLAVGEPDEDDWAAGEAVAVALGEWGEALETLQARLAEFRQLVKAAS